MLKKNTSLIVLLIILALHITLVSYQAKREGTPLLKLWILNGASPVINLTNGSIKWVVRIWRKYFYLKNLYDENLRLKGELQSLKLEAWKNAQLISANSRLSGLLHMKDALPFQTDGARVALRNPSIFFETIFINKGSRQGLRNDIPVICAEGVVGKIISVAYDLAEVQLITNAAAATGAMIEASGIQGVANGTGHEFLALNYVKVDERVNVGEAVVTSGMDGIYPKGLPLGKVAEVKEGPSVFKIIKIKPATDFSTLEDVLLIYKSDS